MAQHEPAVNYFFEQQQLWDEKALSGSVHHLPHRFRNLAVGAVHAQWLSSYEEGDRDLSKNHMTFRLVLATPFIEPVPAHLARAYESSNLKKVDFTYFAALLSMEPDEYATEDDIIAGVLPPVKAGADVIPGIFTIKMLQYHTPTNSAAFARQYPVLPGATLWDFIQSILSRNMDKFLFHIYGDREAKKGCGHFTVRAYQAWIKDGLLTDSKSVEPPHHEFPQDIVYTFYKGQELPQYILIGRGTFLHLSDASIDRGSALVPDDIFAKDLSRASRVVIAEHQKLAQARAQIGVNSGATGEPGQYQGYHNQGAGSYSGYH
ncbi:hypothetical protein SISSUDRAFT_1036726 [Sistotremastrum suecicum HHB10207 ss-3]|uniref:DUF7770 domain-containing protein n=1 Tax=Sistotremastrum suecicum HHB10207 ss-3 TaxID=1314776 RepID=A0A165Z2U6_9AGAM|nr:hypothetical protein SISSUDRAFT_1036726 [Sistotremastrum suecicum HHB10207 ss-3]